MSGHSKWSTIKRQKAVTDARRAAVFTKLAKAITVAAREGGGDPESNFRLRLAIQKGRSANMPNDNVERAIARGAGGNDEATLEEVVYEAYGPGGTGLLIEAVTDNKNRTASELRNLLSKYGGTFASSNSVAWQFHHKGVVRIPSKEVKKIQNIEKLQLELIDAGAEDVQDESEGWTILCPKEKLSNIIHLISQREITPATQGLEYIPTTMIPPENQKTIQTIIDQLEEHDDVENVYTNAQA